MNLRAKSIGVIPTSIGARPFPFSAMLRFTLPEDVTERVHLTVSSMAAFIHHAVATSRLVRHIAADLSDRAITKGRTRAYALECLWHDLKRAQVKTDDPSGVELLMHPHYTADQYLRDAAFSGDCDDVAMFGASIAACMGFEEVDLVVIAREGREWEHVYFRVLLGGQWYVIDPQETKEPFEERKHAKRLTFPVWRV